MKSPFVKPLLTASAEVTAPIFDVAILYESSAANKQAKDFSDQLVTGVAADRVLSLNQWNFRFLGRREVRNAAASAAAVADMVILSMSGKSPLPDHAERWIEMWTWLIDGHRRDKPAVVALFATTATEGARIRAYLRRAAVSKELKFFPQTICAVNGTNHGETLSAKEGGEGDTGCRQFSRVVQ